MNHKTDFIRRQTILLVDDHQEILDFLSDDLSDHYQVELATDGHQALDILEKMNIDLIISDVMMPNMDGFELCVIVKQNLNLKHIPFILLTAKNGVQAKVEGLEFGADAYIDKPFSPSFLKAQISSLLKNRMFLKEHFSQINESENMHVFPAIEGDFMERLQQLIVENLENTSLCVEFLANSLHVSRPTLYRKIKNASNLSPHELINLTRLNKASELLHNGNYKVYEISSMVGFSSSSLFSRNFQKHFGLTPKEWETKFSQKRSFKFAFN